MNQSKIRVLYIIDTLAFGGAQRQLLELIKGVLNDGRYEPALCFYVNRVDFEEAFRALRIPIYRIDKKNKNPILFLMSLVRLIREAKAKIVHTYLVSPNFWGRLAAIIAFVPIIIASERIYNPDKPKREIFADRFFKLFTSMIIVNSRSAEEFLKKKERINPNKIKTIYNGIDLSLFEYISDNPLKTRYSIPDSCIVIGIVGRLVEQKGHEFLFKALSEIHQKGWKLLIIGEGILRESLFRLSEELGISQNIVWVGTSNEVSAFMKMFDFLVLPSLWEGFPNVILEAMAAGKPVIATDVGENNIMVINNKTGFLVPPRDIVQLRKAVEFYLDNAEARLKHGIEGRGLVKKKFINTVMVNETLSVYDGLVREKRVNVI